MADEGEVDVLGDFDLKLEIESDIYDTNELPSKSANLLPEYTNPPWMLEQGWPLDSAMDEKSKATIEKMLLEEQYYINGKSSGQRSKRLPVPASLSSKTKEDYQLKSNNDQKKSSWTDEEKKLFHQGMEIYGRSWTKIAEIIPTRTSIQIKNFAHQYFKSQKKEDSPIPKSTASSSTDIRLEDPLTETITKVTTAHPTVVEPTLQKKSRNSRLNLKQGKTASSRNSFLKVKSASPPKHHKHDITKLGSPKNKKLIQRNDNKVFLPQDEDRNYTHSIEGLNLMSSSLSSNISPGLLDRKMTITPGLIENLDRFCAVADIIERGKEEIEEDDIDIENDDGDDVNLILQNRSTSPNSVYQKLIAEANLKDEGDASKHSFGIDISSDTNVDGSNRSVSSDINDATYSDEGKDENEQTVIDDGLVTEDIETYTDYLNEKSDTTVIEKMDSDANTSENEAELKVQNVQREEPPKAYVNAIFTCDGSLVHFPIPTEEKILDQTIITDEEQSVHKDFFERKSSTKTPERYIRIRNYLLDAWKKIKPSYLNKTSVRSGLKNCGDVNCIGRVHAYLECIGAINFDCDQAAYKHLRSIFPNYQKDRSKDGQVEVNTAKLEAMRPRKRKVKDAFGVWIDEKELEGKTIEHGGVEKEAKQSKPAARTLYDPFKLVPCLSFSETFSSPFDVEIHNSCLMVMDIHSHISKTEVIGMLGGRFCEDRGKLTIVTATPCNSISTGLQCEMDPVSQTQASEEIRSSGLNVVGWYHSHPTFNPNPSVRDIETQLKFQDWFSKGGSKFVGVIVSPYNPRNHLLCSEINCLTVSSEVSTILKCNIPYKFVYTTQTCDASELGNIILTAQDLATSYTTNPHKVDLSSMYSICRGITCLEKMLESLKVHYPAPDNLDLLEGIRNVFNAKVNPHKGEVDPLEQLSFSTDNADSTLS